MTTKSGSICAQRRRKSNAVPAMARILLAGHGAGVGREVSRRLRMRLDRHHLLEPFRQGQA